MTAKDGSRRGFRGQRGHDSGSSPWRSATPRPEESHSPAKFTRQEGHGHFEQGQHWKRVPGPLTKKGGDILGGRHPHRLQVNAHLVVNQFVTHARNISPRDRWVSLAKGGREALGRFADDLEFPNHGILDHRVREKGLYVSAGEVRFDAKSCVADVGQVDPVTRLVHRAPRLARGSGPGDRDSMSPP